jgi:hypothetical protein
MDFREYFNVPLTFFSHKYHEAYLKVPYDKPNVRYGWCVKDHIVFGEETYPLYKSRTIDTGTLHPKVSGCPKGFVCNFFFH